MSIREKTVVNVAEGNSFKTDLVEVNRADVNLTQLSKNIKILKGKLRPETKFMAVVKGDAYSHGLVPISQELEKNHSDALGIVRATEAITLRKAGIKIPIIMLAPVIPEQTKYMVQNEITTMVDNETIAKALNECAISQNKKAKIHIKINTGLNRYGIDCNEAADFMRMISKKYTALIVEGIYTHFRDPEFDFSFTKAQIDKFSSLLRTLEHEGLRPAIAHAAGSAGILLYPEAHLDMVRCGIVLYGFEHTEEESFLLGGLKPIMTIKSMILKIKEVNQGQTGGYGNTFIPKRKSLLAVVGISCGDGISRGWKEVLVGGRRVPVVNYFMDGILIDVTDLGNTVKEFDELVIIGSQGNETITWEDACRNMNTNIDEQFQSITERIPKRYYYE